MIQDFEYRSLHQPLGKRSRIALSEQQETFQFISEERGVEQKRSNASQYRAMGGMTPQGHQQINLLNGLTSSSEFQMIESAHVKQNYNTTLNGNPSSDKQEDDETFGAAGVSPDQPKRKPSLHRKNNYSVQNPIGVGHFLCGEEGAQKPPETIIETEIECITSQMSE